MNTKIFFKSCPPGHVNDEREEARRLKLIELIRQKSYDRSSIFSKATGINASLVSQYKTGARPLTERSILKIEERMNAPGWFGLDGGSESESTKPAVAGLKLSIEHLSQNALMLASFYDKVPVGAVKESLFQAVAALIVQSLSVAAELPQASQPKPGPAILENPKTPSAKRRSP
jgi:hypothetical protein